jgi:hypothetical protein
MAGNILCKRWLGQEGTSHAQYPDFGYATTGGFVTSIIGVAGSLFSSYLGARWCLCT